MTIKDLKAELDKFDENLEINITVPFYTKCSDNHDSVVFPFEKYSNDMFFEQDGCLNIYLYDLVEFSVDTKMDVMSSCRTVIG